MVYRLYKNLYGLKQSLRAWNMIIGAFFISHGFTRCLVKYGVYVKYKQVEILLLVCLYMDDLLIIGESRLEIEDLKCTMK